MPGRKKPYMRIETREDFDKLFSDIYNSGHNAGIEKGLTIGLSYVLELADKIENQENSESNDIRRNAEYMLTERRKAEWEQRQQLIDRIKKEVIEACMGVKEDKAHE